MNLVQGALRIRGAEERPVTTPAEAVGAWIGSLARDLDSGEFHRTAEMREALVSAAEEVDAAARASPGAARLRNALFEDALVAIGGQDHRTMMQVLPWVLSGVFGGILIGLFFVKRRR